MQVTLNGTSADLPFGLTLAELVPTISDRVSGIAVAHNGEVVPRGGWPNLILVEGDQVDVVTAVQGG